MQVRSIMHRDVLTVRPGDSLREAARVMIGKAEGAGDHEVGSAVVRDGDRLLGILTERDLLRAVAAGKDLDATQVGERMTDRVVTAAPNWDVSVAAAEMAERGFRHLVVLEGDQVLGVLSVRDVLPVFLSQRNDDA